MERGDQKAVVPAREQAADGAGRVATDAVRDQPLSILDLRQVAADTPPDVDERYRIAGEVEEGPAGRCLGDPARADGVHRGDSVPGQPVCESVLRARVCSTLVILFLPDRVPALALHRCLLEELGDQGRPARLVAGPHASAVVAVE